MQRAHRDDTSIHFRGVRIPSHGQRAARHGQRARDQRARAEGSHGHVKILERRCGFCQLFSQFVPDISGESSRSDRARVCEDATRRSVGGSHPRKRALRKKERRTPPTSICLTPAVHPEGVYGAGQAAKGAAVERLPSGPGG